MAIDESRDGKFACTIKGVVSLVCVKMLHGAKSLNPIVFNEDIVVLFKNETLAYQGAVCDEDVFLHVWWIYAWVDLIVKTWTLSIFAKYSTPFFRFCLSEVS